MAIRNILTEGDDTLQKSCRPVTEFNERLWTLLDDMAERCIKRTAWVWLPRRWVSSAGFLSWIWAREKA